MRVLVLTTRLFDQPRSGGELCSARLLMQLQALGHELTVLGRGVAPAAGAAMAVHSLGALVPPQAEMGAAARALSLLAACVRRQPWTVHRTQAGGSQCRAHSLLGDERLAAVDLIVVDHLQAWSWLDGLRGTLPPVLLLMHNQEAAMYRTPGGGRRLQAWVLRREAARLQHFEQRALREAAVVLCLSAEDAAALRGDAGAVGVLPGYALQPFVPRRAPNAATPTRRIGLIGSWTWAANRRALAWVLDAVRPLLPAHCELVLAGSGLDALPPLPRVRVRGPVPSAQAFYAEVDVLALAALDGSGVQEKAIEAFGTGLPVVGTAWALRGLQPLPPGVTVADTPQAFASACAQVQQGRSEVESRAWNDARRDAYAQALQRALATALR